MAWANQSRSSDYQQGTLGWRNNNIELQGGGYGERDTMTWWGEAMGAIVLMDGELFAANKINDAFVVISTDGHPDVPVSYENQPVGKTNNNGYLLVSGVSAYYPASYRIDTLNLPADTRLKETERRIAIRVTAAIWWISRWSRSGWQASFCMMRAGKRSGGKPGATRLAQQCGGGYDGIAWLENLSDVNPLEVIAPDGKRCTTLTVGPIRSTSCKPTVRWFVGRSHDAPAAVDAAAVLRRRLGGVYRQYG
jgi:outer membrane usher protein